MSSQKTRHVRECRNFGSEGGNTLTRWRREEGDFNNILMTVFVALPRAEEERLARRPILVCITVTQCLQTCTALTQQKTEAVKFPWMHQCGISDLFGPIRVIFYLRLNLLGKDAWQACRVYKGCFRCGGKTRFFSLVCDLTWKWKKSQFKTQQRKKKNVIISQCR